MEMTFRESYLQARRSVNKSLVFDVYCQLENIKVNMTHKSIVLPYIDWKIVFSILDNYFNVKILIKNNTIIKVY